MALRKSLIILAVIGSAVIGVILISAGGFFMGVKKELDEWLEGTCFVTNRTCDDEMRYSQDPNAVWSVIWLQNGENGTITQYREDCSKIKHPIGENSTCYRLEDDFDWDHRKSIGYQYTIPMVVVGFIGVLITIIYTFRPRTPSYTFRAEERQSLIPELVI
eukprot:TRINITY_DN8979_c0_g1_i1.p1 TRINITY_DN8979_c0_g1~~TRINITY_DN8979_c0_g1_i1.p1  ORF type:complete len:161 (+),score=28.69 TRINITY_DN8979_c0_g1_i1:35-517(+)